jgi:YD repeat-containing protein
MRTVIAAAALAAAALAAAAQAAETITYLYDARGRLVRIERTGSVNNGVATSYQLDKADNRTAKTTTRLPQPAAAVSRSGQVGPLTCI